MFFVFKSTLDLSSVSKNFIKNFNVNDVSTLPPIVFFGVEPVSDDDSFDSDNEGQLSKPSVGNKTIKRHFADILKSKDGTIPDKFIFFNSCCA